jgi:peptidylprolyl isomerase
MFRKFLITLGLIIAMTASAPSKATAADMQAATPLSGEEMAALPMQVTTPSGLQYTDLKVGDGASPRAGQTVTVQYTGTLTNGKKFDSSRDRGTPFSFKIGVGQVIKGWDEGVMGMKIGGHRILKIPADLGYGASGAGSAIPPNATLLFDVELLGVR